MRRHFFFITLILLLAAALTTGCESAPAAPLSHDLAMADMAGMPMDVQAAPATVQQAYQFAAANPEVLQHLPCYCGCGKMGHKSNYDCYVAGQNADGTLQFDTHALGCGICVDITQDAMRLLREGKTVPEIKTYVDGAYARYGPSNMP